MVAVNNYDFDSLNKNSHLTLDFFLSNYHPE